VTNSGGSPVANTKVTFAVALGGGTSNPATAMTNASGIASSYWTLGTVAGPNTLTAIVENLAPVAFSATGVAGPATIMTAEPGTTPQTIAAGAVPVLPAVRVTDTNGNPVAGIKVVFATTTGTIAPVNVNTDANGRAAATSWILDNSAAGIKAAYAYMNGSFPVVNFVVTMLPGPPVGLTNVPSDLAVPAGQNLELLRGTYAPAALPDIR